MTTTPPRRAQCYCYPDGATVDPYSAGVSCRSSAEISNLVLGAEKTQLLILDKDDVTAGTRLFFPNIGDVQLSWELAVTANTEHLRWILSPTTGMLAAGDTQQVVLLLNLTSLQARAAEYRTEVTLNTSSPTPTPNPISSTTAVVIRTVISASPDAARSNVTINNISSIAASSIVQFAVVPIDTTGLTILDAAQIAYSAKLTAMTTGETLVCSVSYDAMSDVHHGECDAPALVAGSFSIRVLDVSGSLVGGQMHHFQIATCPATYFLDDEDSMCKCEAGHFDKGVACESCPEGTIAANTGAVQCDACPTHKTSDPTHTRCGCVPEYYHEDGTDECLLCPEEVVCDSWDSAVAGWKLLAGNWRSNENSRDVRACRLGVTSCPGDNDPMVCPNQTTEPYCACEYTGPLCAGCARNHFPGFRGVSCEACGESKSHSPTIILACTVFGLALLLAGVAYTQKKWIINSEGYRTMLYLRRVGRVKTRVVFFAAQVLSEFALISQKTAGGGGGYPEVRINSFLCVLLGSTTKQVIAVSVSPDRVGLSSLRRHLRVCSVRRIWTSLHSYLLGVSCPILTSIPSSS